MPSESELAGELVIKRECGGGPNEDCPREPMWCGWCALHCSGDEYHSYQPEDGEFDE